MREMLIMGELEFYILVKAVGMTKLFGIKQNQVLDKQNVTYSIHDMVNKKIICKQDARFIVNQPYSELFSIMKEAKKIIHISGKEEFSLYLGDKVVFIEESELDDAAVRMGCFERDEISSLLQDKGLFPEPHLDVESANLQSVKAFIEETGDSFEDCVHTKYQLFALSEGDNPIRSVYLLDNAYNYWIRIINGETTEYVRYTKNVMNKIIEEFLV